MRKKGLSRRLVPTPDGKPTKLDYMICVWIVIIMFWEFQTKNFCGGFEFRVGMRERPPCWCVCVLRLIVNNQKQQENKTSMKRKQWPARTACNFNPGDIVLLRNIRHPPTRCCFFIRDAIFLFFFQCNWLLFQ
jgi:hypothetical protein